MKLKAIETEHNGILYRSRLEARWAVFFDSLGIRFEYEKEGFDLDGIWYLPDFWLPEQRYWVEIKGSKPAADEERKMTAFAGALEKSNSACRFYCFPGGIPAQKDIGCCGPDWDSRDWWSTAVLLYPGADHGQAWCECSTCGKFGVCYEGRTDQFSLQGICQCEQQHRGHNGGSERLLEAYRAARSARFEHRRG